MKYLIVLSTANLKSAISHILMFGFVFRFEFCDLGGGNSIMGGVARRGEGCCATPLVHKYSD